MIRTILAILALTTAPALAEVTPCGDSTRADVIAEPWEDNSASYSNGKIRIAVLDYTEPAATAWKLLILSPPYDEVGYRQCRVVEISKNVGFYGFRFGERKADYDSETGLTLTLPAATYNPETGEPDWRNVTVTINQQTGEITTKGFE